MNTYKLQKTAISYKTRNVSRIREKPLMSARTGKILQNALKVSEEKDHQFKLEDAELCENLTETVTCIINKNDQNIDNVEENYESGEKSGSISSDNDDRFSLNFSDQSVSTDSTVEDETPESKQNLNKQYKKTFCMFCEVLIVSKHFSRHLRQNHKDKSAVQLLMESKCMKEKKEIIANIRAKGVLILQQRTGKIIPKRNPCPQSNDLGDYSICAYCKAFFKNSYITRHNKKCTQSLKSKNAKFENPKVSSFLFSLNSSYQMYLKSNPLRKNLVKKLRMDDIGKTAISDPIILEYGMRLLQTAKNVNKRIPLARNKMRECARLLIEIKPLLPIPSNDIKTIIDILKPEYIDYLIQSVKQVSKYSENERSFGAASYALHQGKTIKDLIDIAVYLLSKKDPIISQDSVKNSSEILQNLNTLSIIVEKNWAREIGSIALKDLNVKKSRNHNKKLLPLTQDIMKLRQYCLEKGKNSILALKAGVDKNKYLILLEVTFLLVLLHNRKRVGDVQFIELRDVTEINNIQETDEIFASLSKTEILLTKFYKKIHTIGKGSKELLILVPRDVQEFIDFLIKDRYKYVSTKNKYLFCNQNTEDGWINGCYVQAKYSKEFGALQPTLIRSSRLRKHIATMMQIMDLRDNEIEQLATFMGHTEKTHREFYRLPKDIMMIAKVSKILLKLEMGEVLDCKNKSLEDVEININDDTAILNSSSENEDAASTSNFTIPISSTALRPTTKFTSLHNNRSFIVRPGRKKITITNKIFKITVQRHNHSTSSSESEKDLIQTKRTTKEVTRWTDDELSLLKTHFASFISNASKYPNTSEMKTFIDKQLKTKRTVAQIRSKIQHLKRKL